MSMSTAKQMLDTLYLQHLKAKYHLMESTYLVLQFFDQITDVTIDCACVVATYLINRFFTHEFKVGHACLLSCFTHALTV